MARILRSLGITAMVVLASLFSIMQVAGAAPAQQATDSVEVSDQPIVGGEMTVANITSAVDGWIVVHLDEGGKPGKVIGFSPVKKGANTNVKIKLTEDVPVGGMLWPMLHIDAGTIGTYEFPGADAPVKDAAGNVVMMQITVTAAAATPAAPAAPAAPSTLPRTGGTDGPMGLVIVAFALLGAGALLLRRRSMAL